MNHAVNDRPTAWAPLRHKGFAVLWSAAVLSNIGTWMHEIAAGWLMADLNPSPQAVSLIQAAATLPMFLFGLLAGTVADAFDRRRILLLVNALMGATALAMSIAVHRGQLGPWGLVAFTFLLATGAAFIAPAWQAIVPSLVPREQLQAAVGLNSMGINISRAVGPALAGAMIVTVGISAPFVINALSFVVIVAAVVWWSGELESRSNLPRERLGASLITGLRHVRNNPLLTATLARAVVFFLFASAYWALLPLIVRFSLDGQAALYGSLVGLVGAGAVTGALLLPYLRDRLDAGKRVSAGSLGTALVLVVFATVESQAMALVAAFLAGVSWIVVLATLNAAAQLSLPGWVRGRGLSVFITMFFGAMAAGSLIWGQVAERLGIDAALTLAAAGSLLALPLASRLRLPGGPAPDYTPSMHWPVPIVAVDDAPDRGPVMTMIDYRVRSEHRRDFLAAIQRLARVRRGLGAYRWALMQDAADPDRYVESFCEATWRAHLRHHDRVSEADREIQQAVDRWLVPDTRPVVTHLLGIEERFGQ